MTQLSSRWQRACRLEVLFNVNILFTTFSVPFVLLSWWDWVAFLPFFAFIFATCMSSGPSSSATSSIASSVCYVFFHFILRPWLWGHILWWVNQHKDTVGFEIILLESQVFLCSLLFFFERSSWIPLRSSSCSVHLLCWLAQDLSLLSATASSSITFKTRTSGLVDHTSLT